MLIVVINYRRKHGGGGGGGGRYQSLALLEDKHVCENKALGVYQQTHCMLGVTGSLMVGFVLEFT